MVKRSLIVAGLLMLAVTAERTYSSLHRKRMLRNHALKSGHLTWPHPLRRH